MTRRLVRFGVLALCATLLWFAVDWQETARLLSSADLRLLALAVLLLTLQTVISAERWRLTASRLGISLRFGHALREYYLSQVVNQSLPGGVIGDAGRAVRTKNHSGLLPAAQAVIFERLAGQMGLISIFAAGIGVSLVMPGLQTGPNWFAPAGLAVLGTVLLVILFAGLFLRRFEPKRRGLHRMWADFSFAVCASPVWQRQVALSLATASCNIAAFAVCVWAIGAHLNVVTAITLVPLILFTMLLPLTIAGWGLREGAAAALFPLFGSTAEAGLAASVAFGITILVSVAPFLVIGLLDTKHRFE